MIWRNTILICVCLFYSTLGAAWSSPGHRVVAEIAYQNLTPVAKKVVDRLTYVPGEHYSGRSRFVYIASWADVARARGDNRFNTWHYIDLPDSADGSAVKPPRSQNAVWAIERAQDRLLTSRDPSKQQLYLKLLVHIVGDVHQPLHAINRFSQQYPYGDRGANKFLIKSRYARNLHHYWDDGLGLFRLYRQRYPMRRGNTRQLAVDIMALYPRSSFSDKYLQRKPGYWALESHTLAKRYAYKIKEHTRPSRQYRRQGQKVVKRRLALAGYRLADMINNIYH